MKWYRFIASLIWVVTNDLWHLLNENGVAIQFDDGIYMFLLYFFFDFPIQVI